MGSVLDMPTKAIKPALADSLRSLAECQLQMQTARSAALDGGALGVMAVDAAVTAIVIGTRGTHELWIVALVLLGLSLGLAVRTLRLPGAEETAPPSRPCATLARPRAKTSWRSRSWKTLRKTCRPTTRP
jgi:hypothetical protein